MTHIYISVHPVSHRLEYRGWGGNFSPALRATDYKCPHCIMIEYEYPSHAPLQARHYPQERQAVWTLSRRIALPHLLHHRPTVPTVGGPRRRDVPSHTPSHRLGYTDCPCPGAADLSYPSSALRRSRTVGGGKLVNALTAASGGICVFVEL